MITEKDREELVAYLDGELTPDERAAVERRLGEDPEYNREMESLRATDALLDLYVAPEPRGDLPERVSARAKPRGRLLRVSPAIAAAAALLLVAGLVFLSGGNGTVPETPLDTTPEAAIENLHALEYLALLDEVGEDADAILEDPTLLEEASAILALAAEGSEDG